MLFDTKQLQLENKSSRNPLTMLHNLLRNNLEAEKEKNDLCKL